MMLEGVDIEGLQREDLVRALRERDNELAAVHREFKQFSHAVSHDMKAPLRALEGFAAILIEDFGKQLPEQANHFLQIILGSAHKASIMMDDIHLYSELCARELKLVQVDMEQLARVAFEKCRSISPACEVEIAALPACVADGELVSLVWNHLISNALKFSRKSTAPKIMIEGIAERNANVYTVRDNGVGFDMKYADRLFVLFQRLLSDEKFEGRGVGLAVVRRIVHLHRGSVWAESVPGQGATFSFRLPQVACSSQQDGSLN